VPGRLRWGDPSLGDLTAGLLTQPGGDPAPRRQDRHPFGERLARALRVAALAPELDPAQVHRVTGPAHVRRPGHDRLMHPAGDHAALRARPAGLVGCDYPHLNAAAGAASTPVTCRPSTPNSTDAVSSNTMPAAFC
jgi:hypothetical protein